jgi:EAL domain-containing protein (putative c-di-GMP-specific phosphodiesterase class I)
MGSRALKRWQIDSDLRKAIEYNQFFLQYQPIICLQTGLVESVEALIRWNHPEYGMIPPNDFIPMAEETGLIVSMGEWVLRTALQQFAVWQKLSPDATPKELNINLSRQQLVQPGFSSMVGASIRANGVEASKVHFEITESEVMKDLQSSVQSIEELRAMGAKIDLDDFGTGYSSLACLHQLPIDVLKLDRSLISQLEQGGQYAKLVDLVLKLLSETEVKVIAEGIETQDQLYQLQRLHCQLGQGFLFSRPIDADKVQEFVRKRQNERAGFLQLGKAQSAVFIPKLMSIPMIKSI